MGVAGGREAAPHNRPPPAAARACSAGPRKPHSAVTLCTCCSSRGGRKGRVCACALRSTQLGAGTSFVRVHPGLRGRGSPCRAEPASPQGLCHLPLCPGAPRPRLLTPTGEVPSPLLPGAPQDELRTGLAPPFTMEGEARRGRRHRGRPWGGTWWPRPGSRGDPGGFPPPGRHRIVTGRTEKETPQETPRAFRNTTHAFKSLSESGRVKSRCSSEGTGPRHRQPCASGRDPWTRPGRRHPRSQGPPGGPDTSRGGRDTRRAGSRVWKHESVLSHHGRGAGREGHGSSGHAPGGDVTRVGALTARRASQGTAGRRARGGRQCGSGGWSPHRPLSPHRVP